MGMIDTALALVFGDGRNVVRDTVEVFRPNAEKTAGRDATAREQAMVQFGAEFAVPRKGRFDRFMDGLNRLPRPALALGTLGLFIAAMVDPVWFASRMQGVSLVPEPLWWLLGVVVSFYFGARHQVKTQEFQRSIARTIAQTPTVMRHIQELETLRVDGVEEGGLRDLEGVSSAVRDRSDNAALTDWRRAAG